MTDRRRIAVITDSTCDISPDLIERRRIGVVPLYIVWGTQELRDGVDIGRAAFYARLPTDPAHPRTSQPTPADFARAVEESDACQALIITISGRLSGTFESACGAAKLVDVPVRVFDSQSVSMGLGWQVLAAAQVRDEGGDLEAMVAAAQRVRQKLSVLFTVDTLEYLHRGGRIGGASRLLGTALQLKPMLTVDNVTGCIDAVERIRTRRRALQRIVEATFERVDPGRPLQVAVRHAAAAADAQVVVDQIRAICGPIPCDVGELTPALGVHGGPGVVGVGAFNE